MVDEFFARSPSSQAPCSDFRTTIDVVAKQALRMFLNISAEVEKWDAESKSCFLVFRENPLAEFVILPPACQNTLWYSNVLCGILRGALDIINIDVKATFYKDTLRGDSDTVIKVEYIKKAKESEEEDSD